MEPYTKRLLDVLAKARSTEGNLPSLLAAGFSEDEINAAATELANLGLARRLKTVADIFVSLTPSGRLHAAGRSVDDYTDKLLRALCASPDKAGALASLTSAGLTEDEVEAGGRALQVAGLGTFTKTAGDMHVQLTSKGKLGCP